MCHNSHLFQSPSTSPPQFPCLTYCLIRILLFGQTLAVLSILYFFLPLGFVAFPTYGLYALPGNTGSYRVFETFFRQFSALSFFEGYFLHPGFFSFFLESFPFPSHECDPFIFSILTPPPDPTPGRLYSSPPPHSFWNHFTTSFFIFFFPKYTIFSSVGSCQLMTSSFQH